MPVRPTGLYAVCYPGPVTQDQAERIKEVWRERVGGTSDLIVFDGGARITRLDAPEPTPIYDALAAEFGWSS